MNLIANHRDDTSTGKLEQASNIRVELGANKAKPFELAKNYINSPQAERSEDNFTAQESSVKLPPRPSKAKSNALRQLQLDKGLRDKFIQYEFDSIP